MLIHNPKCGIRFPDVEVNADEKELSNSQKLHHSMI